MLKRPKSSLHQNRHHNWRDFQSRLHRERGARTPKRRFRIRSLIFIFFAAGLLFLLSGLLHNGATTPAVKEVVITSPPPQERSSTPLRREDLPQLLPAKSFSQLTGSEISLPGANGILKIETTIDPDLQQYLLENIDRQNSRYVGIVVMEADSGRVLAMAGYDRTDATANPCLQSRFPAASIFKIVTAATVVDRFNYTADSPVYFSGPKHTLYKRQLTDKIDRYTTTLSLREAFADSINPVFGKFGVLHLRKPMLQQAANAFGFNRPLGLELDLPPSHFQISDQPYNWAEIASGFNLETTISPMHGAVMAATILNHGQMIPPSLIDGINDNQGHPLYQRTEVPMPSRVISSRAAAALGQMMETTVMTGTARKMFRKYQQDKNLSDLEIGGKTGSIDSENHEVHYDWFVGFARERGGAKKIAVGVMVGHEKFIGTRSGKYARMAMSYYFAPPAAKIARPETKGHNGGLQRSNDSSERPAA